MNVFSILLVNWSTYKMAFVSGKPIEKYDQWENGTCEEHENFKNIGHYFALPNKQLSFKGKPIVLKNL